MRRFRSGHQNQKSRGCIRQAIIRSRMTMPSTHGRATLVRTRHDQDRDRDVAAYVRDHGDRDHVGTAFDREIVELMQARDVW
jgi:hypothetical protein